MNFFKGKSQSTENVEFVSEDDSDDTIARINLTDGKETRKGRSLFRTKEGGPNYLEVDQESRIHSRSRSRSTSITSLLSRRSRSPPKNSRRSPPRSIKRLDKGDKLPHHPTPHGKKIVEPSTPQSRTHHTRATSLNDLPNRVKMSSSKKDGFIEEGSATQESKSNLVRKRRNGKEPRDLAIDTGKEEEHEMESIPLHSSGLDYKRKSQEPTKQKEAKVKAKSSSNSYVRKRKDSTSSTQSFPNFLDLQRAILNEVDQDDLDFTTVNPTPDLIETARDYHTLVCKLNIHRVFYNPELEIVNRYCLEYSAICVKTESHGSLFSRVPKTYDRVYKFMNEFIDSISTPLDQDPHGPHVPVLLAKLFHNDFRINSQSENRIGIQIPLFSHSHRLSLERFKSITDNVYARKTYFMKRVDISRHNLSHLA